MILIFFVFFFLKTFEYCNLLVDNSLVIIYYPCSLFFGDYMVRRANPKLYDEVQDVERLREVVCAKLRSLL